MLDLVAELAGRRVRGRRLPVECHDQRHGSVLLPSRPPPARVPPAAALPARPSRSPPVRPEWSVAAQEALLDVWADVAWRWCRAAGAAGAAGGAGAKEDDRDPLNHSARAS